MDESRDQTGQNFHAPRPPHPPPAAVRRVLDRLASGGDVRADKVRKLRAAVRDGRYENALKISVAIDRLLDEI